MLRILILLPFTLLLSACSIFGPVPDRMNRTVVEGSQEHKETLIILLPGMLSDAEDMMAQGVHHAIHRAWPQPDILMADLTLNYYRANLVAERLHRDIILPARQQGYSEIWLAGGSMGGMGTLIYEWHHPGEMTGLVLISPYLGSNDVTNSIRQAGSLTDWDSGEPATQMNSDNYDRLIWQMTQNWVGNQQKLQRVWLMCGDEDRLFPDVQMLGAILPGPQYFPGSGDHSWDYWIPNIETIFGAVRRSRQIHSGLGAS